MCNLKDGSINQTDWTNVRVHKVVHIRRPCRSSNSHINMPNNLNICTNKFLFALNDAANAFQMEIFPGHLEWDTESIHLHTVWPLCVMCTMCIEKWAPKWHFIERIRGTLWIRMRCLRHILQLGIVIWNFMWTFDTLSFNVHNPIPNWKAYDGPLFYTFFSERSTICVQILHVLSGSVWWLSSEKRRKTFYVCAFVVASQHCSDDTNVHSHIHSGAKRFSPSAMALAVGFILHVTPFNCRVKCSCAAYVTELFYSLES